MDGSDRRYSTVRAAGREHFPESPRGFIAIRIVQLILAVACLGTDAYVLSNVLFDGVELTMFVSIATMIACIYYLVVEFGKDAWRGYNYWAVLALDIFLLMFWLIAFALDAARVAPFANGWTMCDSWECVYYPVEAYMELFACMCTVTAFGGVEFVLFIVSLSVHSVTMHRHRAAGLHCRALSAFERDTHNTNNNATVGHIHTNTDNNNTTTPNNNIPLQEKHGHHPAPSYTSAQVPSVPAPAPQQQQQHSQQSNMYAPPPSSSSSVTTPAAAATANPHTQQSPGSPPPAAGYYEPHQQQQESGLSSSPLYEHQHQHHHPSSSATAGASFAGGGPVVVPAPHPGSYEAPGSSAGYA